MSERIIVGNCDQYIEQFLSDSNYRIVHLFDNMFSDERIKNHADLSVLRINKRIFAISKEQSDLISYLSSNGFDVKSIETVKNCNYPDDCKLNFIIIGN